MRKFFKYLLAVVVGSLVSFFLLFIGLLLMVSVITSSGSDEVKVKDNSILVLDINGPLTERGSDNPLDQVMSQLTGQPIPAGLNQILTAIKKSKKEGNNIDFRLIHTGQHYDKKMSGDFFEQLEIPEPHNNLGAGGGTQAKQTAAHQSLCPLDA